ncbi:MAG: diaminopimelate decarboxylase [Roseburia sp.]|nr:diaminopimelate decarboxylase [Anaeroplasma bactoclasticum]MCM1196896.1 diaminopimelate decarboxylase [Roseburia sp.]MCM1557612.1 diaminopimelate decarboxylase [Anaeroplasma bactoclasticum]
MNYQQLKEKYGTPLYIYNVDLMKEILKKYQNNFKSNLFQTEIIYASKALNIKAMLRLLMRYNLSLDVVSLGELYTAKMVGFPMEKVYFHGNNKSIEELSYALKENVGTIVVDNYSELILLKNLTEKLKRTVNIYIRLNVGVEAHTHKYIVTAHVDSKFGVLYQSSEYNQMLDLLKNTHSIHLQGFHCHIGSQIFDLTPYDAAIQKLVEIIKTFDKKLDINLGGGFGVSYTDADHPIPYDEISKHLILKVEAELRKQNARLRKLCIEPGRSIVAEAGQTLYTIGGIKQTPNKLYYFIDGGMTDNIRPALYQAIYHAEIIGKEKEFKKKIVTVAGKCCESGDIIIENTLLPEAEYGDLLLTYTTGAYGYSMSSNYNKALTPAVVFIENGKDTLVVKRQSLEELLEREI